MEKNNMSNKLAIILCNFNDSRFLIDFVKAMDAQKPDEFIVVDDRSTDRSIELLECLQKHAKIRIVKNDGPHSPFGAFVKGCESTNAEFVACFSADDMPKRYYLSSMREVMNKYPMVDVYTCNADVCRENRFYERTLLPFTSYISPDYAVKIFQNGFAKNINQCGIVIKRDWVLKCWVGGGKDTEVNFDCMYSFSSIFKKGFVNVGDFLVMYRSYPNSFGASGTNKQIKKYIEIHKNFCRPQEQARSQASGIWGAKARWKALVALWGIMKLPLWARRIFYNWFYSYDQKVEKL